MKLITLREMCEMLDVSRRAVQGYEIEGVVSPTGKNERGYLLYDENEVERVRKVKKLQNLGFTIKEIHNLLDGPADKFSEALEIKIIELGNKVSNIGELIAMTEEMIEECKSDKNNKN